MANSIELEGQIKEHEQKIKTLQKEKEEALVTEGLAFKCPCNAVVIIAHANAQEREQKICYNCLRKKKIESNRKELLDKLKFAKLIDIELSNSTFPEIKSITVHKNETMYELHPVSEDGNASVFISREWKKKLIDEENPNPPKPWEKKRKEKPLKEMKE